MYVYMSSSMQRGWRKVRGPIWAAGPRNSELFNTNVSEKPNEVHEWYEWIKPILTHEPSDLLLRPLWHDYKCLVFFFYYYKDGWYNLTSSATSALSLWHFWEIQAGRGGMWVIWWRRSNSRTNTVNVYFNMTAAFQLSMGKSTHSSLNGIIMAAVDGLDPDSKWMHLQLRRMIIFSID